MRTIISFITFFLLFHTYAQDNKAVSWINENAIKIEDANPYTDLTIFNNKIPQKFADAKIFGFGEASHHGKEFFDLKAKFFKYLVKNQNVKVFIMEDTYASEAGINEWISGGKGNVETIAQNFTLGPWYCKEVVNLLEWMRNYNLGKPTEEQIRYYGMDVQNVKKDSNEEIRNLVKKYNIPVSEELLLVVDKCVEKKVEYGVSIHWADIQIPKLNEIESILLDFRKSIKDENIDEFDSVMRTFQNLSEYTDFVQNNYSQDRDLKMFENAKWIIENKSKNGKAFIWAHNEHINNKQAGNYSGRNIYNLGRHLKEYYKNDYYSVGFDFGKGVLPGYNTDMVGKRGWKRYELNEPFSKTYAKTLFEAKDEIYFIDMLKALDGNSSDFFKNKAKRLMLGGSGYNPNKTILYEKRFSEMYDGVIFIKSITVADHNLSAI